MTKCVNQCLFADAISLMLDLSGQLLLATGDRDTKIDFGLYLEFVLNAR
jgi:hypothetical protein